MFRHYLVDHTVVAVLAFSFVLQYLIFTFGFRTAWDLVPQMLLLTETMSRRCSETMICTTSLIIIDMWNYDLNVIHSNHYWTGFYILHSTPGGHLEEHSSYSWIMHLESDWLQYFPFNNRGTLQSWTIHLESDFRNAFLSWELLALFWISGQ